MPTPNTPATSKPIATSLIPTIDGKAVAAGPSSKRPGKFRDPKEAAQEETTLASTETGQPPPISDEAIQQIEAKPAPEAGVAPLLGAASAGSAGAAISTPMVVGGVGATAAAGAAIASNDKKADAPVATPTKISSNAGGDTATVDVAENTHAVTTVTANADAGETLTYSLIEGTDSAQFTINAATGALTFIGAPNFENPSDSDSNNTYSLTVQVSDGSTTDIQTITVTVSNVNEAPVITSSAAVNLAENNVAVSNVTATDVDAGDGLTFSITGGADAALFSVNATTGALAFIAARDFETPADAGANNVYDVQITATDTAGLTSVQNIAVTLSNINEAPVVASSAAVNIAENTLLANTLNAIDPDAGTTLTYSLADGADVALFDINPATGALTFKTAPDFEAPADVGANNVYDITVQVSDGINNSTQALAITVTDINAATLISNTAFNLSENATSITNILATTDGGTLTYSLAGGADADKFAIDSTTGAIRFITAPDFEIPGDSGNNNIYDVIVQATDGTTTATQALTITVTNNNEAPAISSNAALTVAENSTNVATISASDVDAGDSKTFAITGGADAALFSIHTETGALAFISARDFENMTDANANGVYDVQVTAKDGAGLSAVQDIAVTVSNVNEAPTISSNGGDATASVSVAENSSDVTTVTAGDVDAADSKTFAISGGADAALFSINAATGALAFVSARDFESKTDAGANGVYDVQISVSDTAGLSDVQDIAVTVNDVNEAPVFSSGATTSVSMTENTTHISTVQASDVDADTSLVYSLVSGGDSEKFTINANTGVLAFISAPDFEAPTDVGTNNIYDVSVQVSDGAATAVQTIAVNIGNANEAPTISTTSANVAGNGAATLVTTVAASDVDANSTLSYSLVGGVDADKFSINASTGALVFKSAPNFKTPTDSGANNVYDVTVQVSDGTLSSTQAIAVTVLDVASTTITSNGAGATATLNMAENTNSVTTITGIGNATLSYSLVGGADDALFAIDASTGALTFKTAPNFEAPNDAGVDNIYDVIVKADDGSTHDTQAIAVKVINVNEAPAIVGGTTANVNAAENSTAVTTVTSSDVDANDGKTFSISGGVDAVLFAINTSTGVVTFKTAADFETKSDAEKNGTYDLQVTVTDTAGLTGVQSIAVTVTDLTEAPVITGNGGVISFAENTLTAVTTITATDQDAGATLTYSLAGADAGKFTINPSTGVLSFVSAPDFETPASAANSNSYEINAQVSDGIFTTSQALTVNVTDVNDLPIDLAAESDLGASNTDNITKDNTPTFNITASDGATVTLFNDINTNGIADSGETLGSLKLSGTTAGAITSSTLNDGVYSNIRTIQTDALGNTGTASKAHAAVTIDTVAPEVTGAKTSGTAGTGLQAGTTQNVSAIINFSESVNASGSPKLTNVKYNYGGSSTDMAITSTTGNGTNALAFNTSSATEYGGYVKLASSDAGITDIAGNGLVTKELYIGDARSPKIDLSSYMSPYTQVLYSNDSSISSGFFNGYLANFVGTRAADYIFDQNRNPQTLSGVPGDRIEGGKGADVITLQDNGTTTSPYNRDSIYIKLGDSTVNAPDTIIGFDTKSFTTGYHDQLLLHSGTIAANVSYKDGVDVGQLTMHSIANGLISFPALSNRALVTSSIDIIINKDNLHDAISYLQKNITTLGNTVGFEVDTDNSGTTDSLYLFQDNGTIPLANNFEIPDTLIKLAGVTGTTLGNSFGNKVITIADSYAGQLTNAALTTDGFSLNFSEPVASIGNGNMLKNGNVITNVLNIEHNTDKTSYTVHTNQNFSASDYMLLDMGTVLGGSGNNTIDLTGFTVYGNNGYLIFGKAGNDTLLGASTKDTLYGDEGMDIMTGGAGIDSFGLFQGDSPIGVVNLGTDQLFNNGDTIIFSNGVDRITDFSSSEKINIDVPHSIVVNSLGINWMGQVNETASTAALPADGLATDQGFFLTQGNYVGTTFTVNNTGTDTLVMYDGDSSASVTQTGIVLSSVTLAQLNAYSGSNLISHI